jgi:hypothetical protein
MPARIEVIVFNGIRFRRYPDSRHTNHRNYFSPGPADAARGVEALHREIWKASHGPIPSGAHIHHRDGNALNNALDNLACLSDGEHKAAHAADGTWKHSPAVRRNLDRIRPLTKEWHRSEEGHEWHSEHGKRTWENRAPQQFDCAECGTRFESKTLGSPRDDGARFCSRACAARTRRREGRNRTEKTCPVCGKQFMGAGRTRTCSRECGARLRWDTTGRRVQPDG